MSTITTTTETSGDLSTEDAKELELLHEAFAKFDEMIERFSRIGKRPL